MLHFSENSAESLAPPFIFGIENLVLWARSEIIGSAIDHICSWVSGVRKEKSIR